MAHFSRRLFHSCAYLLVCLGFLMGWHYCLSSPDALWLILAAAFASFITLARTRACHLHVPIILSFAFGLVWYKNRSVGDAIWALVTCVVAGFSLFSQLSQLSIGKKPTPAAGKKIA